VSCCKVITHPRLIAQHDIIAIGGNSAGLPEPILRPSPTTDHDAEILSVEDLYLSYDGEKFPYQ
jgi:hypothetical protein